MERIDEINRNFFTLFQEGRELLRKDVGAVMDAQREKALEEFKEDQKDVLIYNLGTGHGYSVLQVIAACGKACGKELPYEIKPRRAGDIATCYCDPTKAKNELGWIAQYGIEEMCADSWRWQSQNPDGYNTQE